MEDLTTERLYFRLWEKSDFQAMQQYFSKEENARYLGGVQTPEMTWRMLATYIGQYHLMGYSYLAAIEKTSDQLVGGIGLWQSPEWPELELGYWLIPEKQGQGYGTEAANRIKEYAFNTLQLPTLASFIHKENLPSVHLAKRIGGHYEKSIELLHFGPHDVYRYTPD